MRGRRPISSTAPLPDRRVDTSQLQSFRQRAEDLGLDVRDRARVTGFILRKMRTVDLHLFTAANAANE